MFLKVTKDLWWVDLVWAPGAQQSYFITALLSWAKERKCNEGPWVKISAGRDHSPVTIIGKTDCTWGNCFNLLQIKPWRNKPISYNTFPQPSLFPRISFSPDFSASIPTAVGGGGMGLWSIHPMVSFLPLLPQQADSSCSSTAPAEVQSTGENPRKLLQCESFPWTTVLYELLQPA